MHSHRSEAYAVLSAFLFIAEYSKYFSLQFNNQCTLYCDNKEIVKKIKKLSTTTNHFQPYYKMSEHEAIIAIQHYLPSRINVIHLYSHQDKVKGKDKLTFPEKLNNLADSIADNYARSPINNHIPLTPLAVYFNHNYIPNNYQYYLRRLYFQKDANEYIKAKYNWSARTSTDIDWESHGKIVNKPSNHSYHVKVKFIHQLLSSGKKNYSIKHACPHCKIQEHAATPYDHFLVCSASEKKTKPNSKTNSMLNTPR